MKIFKNKFFLIFTIIISVLFLTQFYFISNSFQRDTNSYVTLIQWQWRINTHLLTLYQKQHIQQWDVISTIWTDALAVIEWWDKSITRLGWNTSMKVEENFVGSDVSEIRISFELLRWKTWSNVLSVLWEKSYFKQHVKWAVAAVRGTVFEVNYDKDFISVHNHEVQFTSVGGNETLLQQGQAFSLRYSDFITDILQFRDQAWEELNKRLDAQYLEELRKQFLHSLKQNNPLNLLWYISQDTKIFRMLEENNPLKLQTYLQSLPEEKQANVLAQIEKIHQSIHFETGENSQLYTIKQNARDLLIQNSENQEKALYLRYVLFDINDMIYNGWSSEILEKNVEILQKQVDFIQNYGQSNIFWFESEALKNILFTSNPKKLLQDMVQKWKWFDQKWQDFIHNQLRNIFQR